MFVVFPIMVDCVLRVVCAASVVVALDRLAYTYWIRLEDYSDWAFSTHGLLLSHVKPKHNLVRNAACQVELEVNAKASGFLRRVRLCFAHGKKYDSI